MLEEKLETEIIHSMKKKSVIQPVDHRLFKSELVIKPIVQADYLSVVKLSEN